MRGPTPNGGIDRWVSMAARKMGVVISDVIQPGAFVWFEKTALSQGATCSWMAADEAVGCTRAFLMIKRSSS
ncbi:hypothetical protein TNCV_4919691 [Trichonephila clavipes]|nr:hypothetical protein TNCV_4919691 [Trichonephila clavipes]